MCKKIISSKLFLVIPLVLYLSILFTISFADEKFNFYVFRNSNLALYNKFDCKGEGDLDEIVIRKVEKPQIGMVMAVPINRNYGTNLEYKQFNFRYKYKEFIGKIEYIENPSHTSPFDEDFSQEELESMYHNTYDQVINSQAALLNLYYKINFYPMTLNITVGSGVVYINVRDMGVSTNESNVDKHNKYSLNIINPRRLPLHSISQVGFDVNYSLNTKTEINVLSYKSIDLGTLTIIRKDNDKPLSATFKVRSVGIGITLRY